MADIFNHAYLTVVAASADSCNESFPYREKNRPHCTLPFGNGFFSLRHQPRTDWQSTDKMAEIVSHKWITRGWTFYEERLARRVLMFGENRFFFDCRTLERVEDTETTQSRPEWTHALHEGLPDRLSGYRINTEGMLKCGPEDYSVSTYESHLVFDHWQTLCNHSSRRVPTFDKDRLPAISSIASKISQRTNSPYLAGLLKDNLVHDLFWKTVKTSSAPESYRAPSWSWASVNGHVRWHTRLTRLMNSRLSQPHPSFSLGPDGDIVLHERFNCTSSDCNIYADILEVQTTLAGLDPFGAVSDGHLKICASVNEVQLKGPSNDVDTFPWHVHSGDVELAKADLDEKHGPKSLDGITNWCAVLIGNCSRSSSRPRGLLLRNPGQNRAGLEEFRRIGLFVIFGDTVISRRSC
jgi:hypothetical protein